MQSQIDHLLSGVLFVHGSSSRVITTNTIIATISSIRRDAPRPVGRSMPGSTSHCTIHRESSPACCCSIRQTLVNYKPIGMAASIMWRSCSRVPHSLARSLAALLSRVYAEILHRWGHLLRATEVRKFVTPLASADFLTRHKGIGTAHMIGTAARFLFVERSSTSELRELTERECAAPQASRACATNVAH